MMKEPGPATYDRWLRFPSDSTGVKNSTKRIADAVKGACCLCLWPLYANLGISHRQAASDRPEVREINARQGYFIIVILFFHTLPLTFNFAPELIVCFLQYDWCRRIQAREAPSSGLDNLNSSPEDVLSYGQTRRQTGIFQRNQPMFLFPLRADLAKDYPFLSMLSFPFSLPSGLAIIPLYQL